MALLTKAQTRTAVAQAIDDPDNKRWSAANLDILITLVCDTMFEAVLDSFEWLTSQSDTVTPSAGAIALSGLTKRFYRVQDLIKVSDTSHPHGRLFTESIPQPSYYMLGANIVTDPAITGSSSATVIYSYLPTRFNDLASDGTALPAEYPDGHESALVYLTAAWALAKGDAESIQQTALIADQALESMLTHIARRYPVGANARVQQVKASLMRNFLVKQ